MKKLVVRVLTLFFIAAALLASLPAFASGGGDLNTVVSTEKSTWTPRINTYTWGDCEPGTPRGQCPIHEVWDYEPLGGGVLAVCGQLTAAQEAGSNTWVSRTGVFAFNTTGAERGKITAFAPQISNGDAEPIIHKCDLSYDKKSLILAGSFKSVNGQARSNLAKINLASGAVEPFAQTNSAVTDIEKAKGRYFVFGRFTQVNGIDQLGIATVTKTGAFDPYFRAKLAGQISPTAGITRAYRGTISQGDKYMAAIVNADTIGGKKVRQVAAWNLGKKKASLRNWQLKPAYDPRCQSWMVARDITTVPGSQDIVTVATGGPRGGICDRVVRAPLNITGQRVKPSWINRTCGDTLHAVAATSKAIYAQGHQKCASDIPGPKGNNKIPRFGIHAMTPKGYLIQGWRSDQERCVGGKSLYVLNQAGYPKGLLTGNDCGTGIIFRAAN